MLNNDYKIEYLKGYNNFKDDTITTVLENHVHKVFAYHTWYARKWDDIHNRTRIMNVKNYCDKIKIQ